MRVVRFFPRGDCETRNRKIYKSNERVRRLNMPTWDLSVEVRKQSGRNKMPWKTCREWVRGKLERASGHVNLDRGSRCRYYASHVAPLDFPQFYFRNLEVISKDERTQCNSLEEPIETLILNAVRYRLCNRYGSFLSSVNSMYRQQWWSPLTNVCLIGIR